MIIKSADFIISAVKPQQFPKHNFPEFAFIGRSNVGKSSLINMLTNRKLLAKISGKPGKTRTLNFFTINNQWSLVDMPGYGYAKTSKTERELFATIIKDYLDSRKNMLCLFILIDSRHEPLDIDFRFIQQCAELMIPFALIYTKADKNTANKLQKTMSVHQQKLLEIFEELPSSFVASAIAGKGREDILNFIQKQSELYSNYLKKL